MKIINIGKFAVKNAFRKKTVAILAIVGIGIGLTLQIVINSYSAGMQQRFDEIFSELAGSFEIQEKNQPTTFMSQLPSNITSTIRGSPYNTRITSMSYEQQLPPTVGELYNGLLGENMLGRPRLLNIRGIVLENFMEVYSDLDELTLNSRYFTQGADECIIPYDMWKNNTELFDIGKTISLMVNNTYYYNLTIVGIIKSSVGGIRQSFTQTGYDVYTSIEVTTKILNEILRSENHFIHYESRGYTSVHISPDNYNILTVKTDITDTDKIQEYMDDLLAFLDQQYSNISFSSYSIAQALSNMSDYRKTMNTVLLIISIVTVLAGGMGIIIAQLVGVDSRLKEFAIMKATGWKEHHIILTVLIESITLGIIGALAAVSLSGLFILIFSHMPSPAPTPIFTPTMLVTAFGVSLFLGLVGGLYPGFRASSVNPIEILRGG